MNAMTFAFREKELRVLMIEEAPWWVAADLCELLGLGNVTMALKKLRPDQMTTLNRVEGGNDLTLNPIEGKRHRRDLNIVCESGMWTLVLRSDRPEAVEVQMWLTGEVLPALRKFGFYQMPGFDPPPMQAMDLDPQRLAVGVSVVREARRLYGPMAARSLWVQVGLPPVTMDSEAVLDTDPFAVPLLAYLAGRAETTIQQAAEGIGIAQPDHSTRYRIGKLLKVWGWTPRNRKVGPNRTARVFTRSASPASDMVIDAEPSS